MEDFFCRPLGTTSKDVDVVHVVADFFETNILSWANFVGVCTDGAPAMIGDCSDLLRWSSRQIQEYEAKLFTSPTGPSFKDTAVDPH